LTILLSFFLSSLFGKKEKFLIGGPCTKWIFSVLGRDTDNTLCLFNTFQLLTRPFPLPFSQELRSVAALSFYAHGILISSWLCPSEFCIRYIWKLLGNGEFHHSWNGVSYGSLPNYKPESVFVIKEKGHLHEGLANL
jgi:hypothetical protein